MGLYKNGQLIDSFGPVAPTTNAAPKMLSAKIAGTAIPQTAVAPAISADTQARNQVFADSARLGIQIQETLRQMQNPGLNTSVAQQPPTPQQLASLLQQLIAKQVEVRAAFDSTVARLVELKMPPEIFQRHFDAVAVSEAGFAAFTNAVNEVLIGSPGALDKAVELMNQMRLRNEPDLTRKGPTHQAMPILTAPQLTPEEAEAAQASQAKAPSSPAKEGSGKPKANYSPPTPDDLAETPDIQLTTEIRAKAAALGYSPAAIYEFVRNKCAFQPYLGSRKGALNTLRQLAGNDTDQASLLVALLRAAGIPCRYVRGTLEMTPAQAKSWLGVDDYSTAANILATARFSPGYYNGNLRCTRVWVEAYLPYSNYRGVPNDDTGKTWIPLDPAFKETIVTSGEDTLGAMGYDNWAYLVNYVSAYNSNSPIEQLQLNIQGWLSTNSPGTNLADIERKTAIKTQYLGLLPSSLPNELISAGDPFPALSDTNRYKVRFQLYNGGTTFIDFTTNLSELAGHKVTINYVGATPVDQALIDSYGGIYQTPPNLVYVKPLLKVDGNIVAASANSTKAGYQYSSDMQFIPPAGGSTQQSVISNDITAGNSQAIAVDTFMDVPNLFLSDTNAAPDSLLMNLLHGTATDYLSRVDRGEEESDRLLRTVHTVDVSEAIVESSVSVWWSGGAPVSFEWTGMIVDADRRIVGPFGVNGDSSKEYPFMLLSGYDASFMENDVFEDMYDQMAVSTVRILQLSRDQGIPTCYITNSISTACPGFSHSTAVRNAVTAALGQGHVVIIPRSDITVSNWSGTGYIDLDPTTGAAGYIISGGISGSVSASGGATVDTWPINLGCTPVGSITGTITPNSFSNGQILCPDGSHIKYTVELHYNCMDAQGHLQPKTFPATSHTVPKSNEEILESFGPGVYTISIPGTSVTPVTFTLLDVISLKPDKGQEIDDGDNNDDTKTYIVCFSSTTGDQVTMTATPVPATAESSLPSCWSLSGGTGSGKLVRTIDQTTPDKIILTAKSGTHEKKTTVIVLKVELVTPAGDPVAAPVDSGEGQNEFTFSTANSGVLRMDLKAHVEPSGVASKIKDICHFTVDPIGSSTMAWDTANPGGKPTVSWLGFGNDLLATVRFTGLPANNSDFGKKKAAIHFAFCQRDVQNYEVFFSRDAKNHPGGKATDPNWFYYWQDGAVCGIDNLCAYDAAAQFGYTLPGTDNITRLGPLAPTANDGPNTYVAKKPAFGSVTGTATGKGIKCVAETIRHERHHLEIYNAFGYLVNHGITADDSDGDTIKHTIAHPDEAGYDGVTSDSTDADTFNLVSVYGAGSGYGTYGDNEVRCRVLELNLNITLHADQDWASPGCQSKNKNGP